MGFGGREKKLMLIMILTKKIDLGIYGFTQGGKFSLCVIFFLKWSEKVDLTLFFLGL